MNRRLPSAALALVLVAGAALAQERLVATPRPLAVLQGLDKITARISTIEAPLDEPVRFGGLEITVRACFKTPPEEPPEAAAFLQVDEVGVDRPRARLFSGWMYASSPAVSALEHPVYDLRVIDCAGEPPAADEPPAQSADKGEPQGRGDASR